MKDKGVGYPLVGAGLKVISGLYRFVFKEELGLEAKRFLSSLFFVTLGSGVAAIVTFAFTILGGRFLGPTEFGKFSLIQSTAFILYIPMIAGFSVALVKYTSETGDIQRQRALIGVAYRLTAISTAGSLVLIIIFSSWISKIFAVNSEMFITAVIVSVACVLYTLANSTQRGLKLMKAYAVWQPAYALILILSFIILIALNVGTFQAMVLPLIIAYGVTGVAIMVFLNQRKYVSFNYDRLTAKDLIKYSVLGLIVLVSSTIYTNIGRIFVANYMSFSEVGIYSAYYGSSINLGSILFITFNAVFFPTISGYEDKKPILATLDRLLPYLVVLGTMGIFIFEIAALTLFGDSYPKDTRLMFMFAITTVLNVWYLAYAWIYNAEGLKGARYSMVSTVSIALIILLLSFILIPVFGLEGAISSAAIAFGFGIIILRFLRKSVFGI